MRIAVFVSVSGSINFQCSRSRKLKLIIGECLAADQTRSNIFPFRHLVWSCFTKFKRCRTFDQQFCQLTKKVNRVRAQNIFRLDRALLFIMLVPVSTNEGLKVHTPCHLLQQKSEVGACTNEPLASCNPLDWNIWKEKQTQTLNKQKSRRVHQLYFSWTLKCFWKLYNLQAEIYGY